jgi:4-amino-4-deoxy-L-arabinose transferase-like glycosyltransferase
MQLLPQLIPPAYTLIQLLLLAEFVIFFVLFGANMLTRTGRFSPDSMNYVDVARNIVAGRGLVQSTIGFNSPGWLNTSLTLPPMTAQPPLYPLLIALLHRLGWSLTAAALLVSCLGYAAMVAMAYVLVSYLYDARVALVSVGCLILLHPLRKIATYAWSETLGLTFVLASFWLACYLAASVSLKPGLALAAGVLVFLAFATRYIFVVALVVAGLPLIVMADPPVAAASVGMYGIGFLLPAGVLLWRNWSIDRRFTGPARNRSTVGLGQNIRDAYTSVFGCYMDEKHRAWQIAIFEASLLLFWALLTQRAIFLSAVHMVLVAGQRSILPIWIVAYAGCLIYQRTRVHFDTLDIRLTAPVSLAVAILWSALFVTATDMPFVPLTMLVFVAVLPRLLGEVQTMVKTPARRLDQDVLTSDRLCWIASATTQRDLIIGDSAVDIPFFLARSPVISFSRYPFTDHLSYDMVRQLAHNSAARYEHVYLVLRDRFRSRDAWRRAYGDFVADLVHNQYQRYPGVQLHCRLQHGYVFSITAPEES